MAVEILEFFETSEKDYWIEQIKNCDWEAGRYLAKLLKEDKLKDLCGPSTKVYMLVENKTLYSFCTLAEQDEVKAPEMTPWLGFVFTISEYRGNHYATRLLTYVCDVAKKQGATEIFCSPSNDTFELYEKLGFTEFDYPMMTIYGYETSVFHKDL